MRIDPSSKSLQFFLIKIKGKAGKTRKFFKPLFLHWWGEFLVYTSPLSPLSTEWRWGKGGEVP